METATARKIVAEQYDYQLYPGRLSELLAKTGADNLKIIPIGDADSEGDFWVIPFKKLKDLLVHENLTKGLDKNGKPRVRRWRFHMEQHLFVLFPGNRVRLGEIDLREFYAAKLPT